MKRHDRQGDHEVAVPVVGFDRRRDWWLLAAIN